MDCYENIYRTHTLLTYLTLTTLEIPTTKIVYICFTTQREQQFYMYVYIYVYIYIYISHNEMIPTLTPQWLKLLKI